MSLLLKNLLSEAGLTPETVSKNSRAGKFWQTDPVTETTELLRIRALPRRVWQDDPNLDELRTRMTHWLRKPGSRAELFPVQAMALAELAERGRGYVIASVGGGKTAICALAPTVLDSKRPLFLSYAKLIDKTIRDFRALAEDWRVAQNWSFMSVESLSLAKNADFLNKLQPTCIVIDEAHVVGNMRAGRTKRLGRYLAENPECVLVPLTGTPGVSITRYAHLLEWALGEAGSPLPTKAGELAVWASALDPDVQVRREPGALTQFSGGSELLDDVRAGVGQRVEQTPGVVYHRTGFADCSLYLSSVLFDDCSPELDAIYEFVRESGDELPDGRVLETGLDKALLFQTLGLGLSRVVNPKPPEEWRAARKAYASLCTEMIHEQGIADTPGQLALMIERGEVDAFGIYEAWKTIEPSFKMRSVVHWFDDSAVQFCADWAKKNKGLVWVPFPAFARRLQEISGMPFFWHNGCDSKLGPIEEYSGDGSVIVSTQACSTGRNLQKWSKNLIVGAPASPIAADQLLGRTHRHGQTAEEVTAEFFVPAIETLEAIYKARGRAEADKHTGRDQGNKLIHSDWLIAQFTDLPEGPRWQK